MKRVLLASFLVLHCAAGEAARVHATQSDEECISWAIWDEARGESLRGQRAVVDVIQTRMKLRKLTACEVVKQAKQFSGYRGEKRLKVSKKMLTQYWLVASMQAVAPDCEYFRTTKAKPFRQASMIMAIRVGRHLFFKPKHKGTQMNTTVKTLAKPETPAQRAGLVIGDKYAVLDGENTGWFSTGDVVVFTADDGTHTVRFTGNNDVLGWVRIGDVRHVPKTPAEEAGMVVGNRYEVIEAAGEFVVGDIATLTEDDGTDLPWFVKDGEVGRHCLFVRCVKAYVEKKTPAQLAGITVGQKCEVIDNGGCFNLGDIITLVEDDGTELPYFSRTPDGRSNCVYLYRVKPYVEPVAKTPAELLGYAVGQKFSVVSGQYIVGKGVTLARDDGTTCPKFKTEDGDTYYLYLTDVGPYVEAKTPAQAAGLVIGLKYTNSLGDVLTFTEDDESNCPWFEYCDGGRTAASWIR